MKKQVAVLIGTFYPVSIIDQVVIEQAAKDFDKVVVIVDNHLSSRSMQNPFSSADSLHQLAILTANLFNVFIAPVPASPYNQSLWIKDVQTVVNDYRPEQEHDVTLISSNDKQLASLAPLFPRWVSKYVEVSPGENTEDSQLALPYWNSKYVEIVSEETKESITQKMLDGEDILKFVPEIIQEQVKDTLISPEFQLVLQEAADVKAYKKSWEVAPYAPTFLTADAVVIQSGHILLVERKFNPGAGLYALPGGFVNQSEKLVDACIRELREETRLKVPEPVLYGSIKTSKIYDSPDRSARGRTVTQAFLIELKNDPNGLPKVKGSDDATRAFWLPLSELDSSKMFEDHYHIIKDLAL